MIHEKKSKFKKLKEKLKLFDDEKFFQKIKINNYKENFPLKILKITLRDLINALIYYLFKRKKK